MIVLNEKKHIEEILNGNKVIDNMYHTLGLLIRYWYQENNNISPKELYKKSIEFLENKGEHEFDWQNSIDRLIKKRKLELIEIDYIPITKNELNIIKEIKNRRLEKLSFTLLCVAKLNNRIKPNNNNWVNRDVKEIFKLANIRDNIKQQYISISEIKDLGLLKYSKKVDNINLCVTFIDNDEVELKINDYRDLGYQYLAHLGDGFIKCECCEKLVPIKSKTKKPKYCEECAYRINIEKTIENRKKFENLS